MSAIAPPLRLAWRILTHDKGRTALVLAGVFIAILLVFIELGFFFAVPQGGMLVYDHMRFDLLLVSDRYVYQAQAWSFPRNRLTEAAAVTGVARATPIYFGAGKWQDPAGGLRIDVFLVGLDPPSRPLEVADVDRQVATLQRPDTMLVDATTRSIFGPLTTGRVVEIGGKRITIGGDYRLGTGFLGLGVALLSEANFFRLSPGRGPDSVNLGLISLQPGADPDQVAAALRRSMPNDVRVFTRPELLTHETAYWTTRTAVGLIFGSGLIISFIVGIMVLYQTLATQISRYLPQFATLKAIGYSDRFLGLVVVIEGMLIVVVAFVPAAAAAAGVYGLLRAQTLLPIDLSWVRLASVLVLALVMSSLSALLSLGGLRRADPADIF